MRLRPGQFGSSDAVPSSSEHWSLVREYARALEQKDLSRCLSFFTDHSVIHFLSGRFEGTAALERWHLQRFAASARILRFGAVRVREDLLQVDAAVSSRTLENLRIPAVPIRITIRLEGAKIHELRLGLRRGIKARLRTSRTAGIAAGDLTFNAVERPIPGTGEELYLDLLKKVLTRSILPERYRPIPPQLRSRGRALYLPLHRLLGRFGLELVARDSPNAELREQGFDWPAEADTMVGLRRLDNVQFCVEDVLRNGVPGDLIEAGVWRGGVTILMRAVLKVHNDTERTVWAADSFRGLPKPDARFKADAGDLLWTFDELAVSLERVKANFARYGLLDNQVRFLEGWFKDTLATAPIEKLAVLRMDGDLYESTLDTLNALYHKVSRGGYVIVDDYNAVEACARAVTDFRTAHHIHEPIQQIDAIGVYWQRS